MRAVKLDLDGWGKFRSRPCRVYRPERTAEATQLLTIAQEKSWIARGLGRSYGDSALNDQGGTVLTERLDRMIDFDTATGELYCESGVSFADILKVFLPRGWFPPVTPGTKFITLGGAIAADIHGKNHHVDGSFGQFVKSLELLTGRGDVLRCSPEENAQAFWATVGGMGLTGLILRARFQLIPVQTSFIKVTYKRARNLGEALSLLAQDDQSYRYSVAWIDCLATGQSLGRSVLMRGNHALGSDLPPRLQANPLALSRAKRLSIPFNFPGFVLNPLSIKIFNNLYYFRNRDGVKLQDYDSFFYPLDQIGHWNRMYGKRGFIQYQALLPPEHAERGMAKLLEQISSSRQASFLAVLKSTGKADPGLLSFTGPGFTLALDLPNTGRKLAELVARLDEIVLSHQGRLYLAKDSLMSRETIARMYERIPEFLKIKSELDPSQRFISDQGRRLGLIAEPAAPAL